MNSMEAITGQMIQLEVSGKQEQELPDELIKILCGTNDVWLARIIKKYNQLGELNLSNCRHISSEGFEKISFPDTLLRFTAQNTRINSSGVTHVSKICPKLEYLDLGKADCTEFSTARFPKTLLTLKIPETAIRDRGFSQIMKYCLKLKVLDLTGCKDINASSFEEFAFPQDLQVLLISGTRIDNKGLKNLAFRCCNLMELDLKKCHYGITLQGIYDASFSEQLKTLALPMALDVWEKRTFARTYPQVTELSF